MTNAEMAAKYAAEHPTPIQEKCPIIIQYKKKSDGWHYWCSLTGEKIVTDTQKKWDWFDITQKYKDRINQYDTFVSSAGTRGYRARYANYIEEYDCIEIASIHMLGNIGKENEPREWTFDNSHYFYHANGTRLFMFKNEKHLYDQNGNIWHPEWENKYYNTGFKYFCQELNGCKSIDINESEFQKFAGAKHFRVSSWNSSLRYPHSWQVWYEKSAPRPVSKTQSVINELINTKLTPLKTLEEKYPVKYTIQTYNTYYGEPRTSYEFEDKDFIHFEIINDDYCVLRYLLRNYDRWGGREVDFDFAEPCRIYIDKNGKASVCQLINEEYKITSQKVSNIFGYYDKPKFGNLDQIKNWKRLSWIENILTENNNCETATLLVAILRHPILELVYKAGYKNIFKILIEDFNVAQNLKVMFGVKEQKKGSITKLLGCNKQTLKWVDEHYTPQYSYDQRYLISTVKEIFNTSDISSWSQESIDMYFAGAQTLLRKCGSHWKYSLQLNCDNAWSWRREEGDENRLTPEQQKSYQKVLRVGSKTPEVTELLIDTLDTYRRINREHRPDISDIYEVNTINEMLRYHDAVVELYNQQEAERRRYWDAQEKQRMEMDKKKFEKLQEYRVEKFEFETEEDDFIIRVPHELVEITNEGMALHHCVGGYLHRHAVGDTNIIFLRKKNLPTIPYYTIEVANNHVVQIHGSCNKWLGASSEALKAIPFVQKWLKKTGISCEKKILLCKATGYGSISDCIDGAQFGL